jgi:hypothetical protein
MMNEVRYGLRPHSHLYVYYLSVESIVNNILVIIGKAKYGPQTHTLHVTYHGEIETVSDAKAILTRCLEGHLGLVLRGPTTQELAQFTKNNAAFVFPELGHWLNPTEWLNELSEPKFKVTAIPNFDFAQGSIKITESGRTYAVMVVFRSHRFSRQAPRRIPWSQYGIHGQAMPWPSQLFHLGVFVWLQMLEQISNHPFRKKFV